MNCERLECRNPVVVPIRLDLQVMHAILVQQCGVILHIGLLPERDALLVAVWRYCDITQGESSSM
jgi:hypothetical protein